MTHRFASIAQPDKLAYVYDSTAMFDGRAPISCRFRFYETYGDGMIQHSPAAPVSLGMLSDYLFSLAKAMLADKELLEAASYEVTSGIQTNRDIRFGFGIIYKEGKRRWFSRKERKVSSSESKRHDRRYEEVTERLDGTARGAYNALWQEHYDGIRVLGLAYSICRYQREVLDEYQSNGSAAHLLGWNGVDADRLESAFQSVLAVIDMSKSQYQAERGVASYERVLQQEREVA